MLNKILRVDLTSRKVSEQELQDSYAHLGGRGLIARILSDEVGAQCDPLSPQNKLIFACGLLAGTTLSCSNRISVGCKSPLTGGVKESSGGGQCGMFLAQLGYRAIVIEGASEELCLLEVNETGIELKNAGYLKGKGVFETADLLFSEYPASTSLSIIGPAGEHMYNIAGIGHTDIDGMPTRCSARGGVGAVMGSKRLKAVVIPKPARKCPPPADIVLWDSSARQFARLLLDGESTGNTMPKYGTAMTLELLLGLGGLPTRNFSEGSFEKAHDIGGTAMHKLISDRGGEGKTTHACMAGCVVRCSNRFADRSGKLVNSPTEYETLAFLGSNISVGDLDQIAVLNSICNDIGADTIETGGAIAAAMSAGVIAFGDYEGTVGLLAQLRDNSGLGELLGAGAAVTAAHYGVRSLTARGQTIGAYDPRAVKSNGVTYFTSPQGGDHTTGNGVFSKVDHHDPNGAVTLSRNLQIVSNWIDSLGICTFARVIHMQDNSVFPGLLNARYGWDWTADDLTDLGRAVIRCELAFNRAAGQPDVLRPPGYLETDKLPPYGCLWDVPFDEMSSIWDDI